MKTLSMLLLLFMLTGCSDSSDKILASQEETNAKIDSLVSVISVLTEPEEPTRKDVIVALFDSLVAYSYGSADIPTGSVDEEHAHIHVRYVEYWVFYINKSELYDGDYEFVNHILTSSFRELEEYEPDYGLSPFSRLINPDIYQSNGKWRILNEREIDVFREGGTYYSFRDDRWDFIKSAILGVSNYSFHDRKFMLVSFQGAISQFNVSTVYNLTSIKNGVFDIE